MDTTGDGGHSVCTPKSLALRPWAVCHSAAVREQEVFYTSAVVDLEV